MEVLLMIGTYGAIPALLIIFGLQFLSLRIRDTRSNPRDPQLGRKCLLYLLFNAAVILALVGLTISSLDWFELVFEPLTKAQQNRNAQPQPMTPVLLQPPDDPMIPIPFQAPPTPATISTREWFSNQQRIAAGLVLSGVFHGLLFWFLLRFATNDREFPQVRRTFAGTRFAIAAIITMVMSTMGFVFLFQKGETDYNYLSVMVGVAVVWFPVAVSHLIVMLWNGNRSVNAETP